MQHIHAWKEYVSQNLRLVHKIWEYVLSDNEKDYSIINQVIYVKNWKVKGIFNVTFIILSVNITPSINETIVAPLFMCCLLLHFDHISFFFLFFLITLLSLNNMVIFPTVYFHIWTKMHFYGLLLYTLGFAMNQIL